MGAGCKSRLPDVALVRPGRSGGRRQLDRGSRRCANLVEAGAAVDGTIVAWGERDDRLPSAHCTDGGVILPRSPGRSSVAGCLPTRGAPLGIVLEPLCGEKGLLACGKGEFHPAVTTGKRAILVHLLCSPSSGVRADAMDPATADRRDRWGSTPGMSDSQSLGTARIYASCQPARNASAGIAQRDARTAGSVWPPPRRRRKVRASPGRTQRASDGRGLSALGSAAAPVQA